jgi:hypothetical protein
VTPRRKSSRGKDVTETTAETLPYSLSRKSPIDPELRAVIDAWPGMSEAIRRAVMALVYAGSEARHLPSV